MTKRTQPVSEGHGSATEAQRAAALGALLAAQDDAAAAKAAGVSARTVRRWRTEDEAFRAELAEGIAAIKAANVERGAPLLGKAIGVLAKHLDADDLQAALGVFRAVTASKHEHSGPGGGPIATVQMPPANDAAALAELEQIQARIAETIAKRKAGG